jgi:hypothetical protein
VTALPPDILVLVIVNDNDVDPPSGTELDPNCFEIATGADANAAAGQQTHTVDIRIAASSRRDRSNI